MKDFFLSFVTMEGMSPLKGVRIKSVSLNNVMMTWMEFDPGSELPLHSHPHEQITTVIEGSLEMEIDGTVRAMSPGDVAVVPSGVDHRARVIGGRAVAIDAWNPVREDYILKP